MHHHTMGPHDNRFCTFQASSPTLQYKVHVHVDLNPFTLIVDLDLNLFWSLKIINLYSMPEYGHRQNI